jgi:Fe-S cluster assembly protein SufB
MEVIEFSKGLNEEKIKKISEIKNEEKWMKDFRLKSYKTFIKSKMPSFGPKININFDDITYYKSTTNKVNESWNDISKEVNDEFKELGVKDIEKKYLDGMGVQYESEVIYHNMLKEVKEKNIIFCDTDTALKKYPELFKKYFNSLVKYDENKFTMLNGAVWSGGTFIYVPKNTKLDRPLQSYFRINTKDMGQFERTLIIVDDNSELNYIEGCTAKTYSSDSLHAAVVEIFVGKNAKCRYSTIQNWSNDVYNLVTKRALVEENGTMEWIDGNIGSKVNMKYPSCILKGDNSYGYCISVAMADDNQIQDTGAKMIHLGKNTKSKIIAKSIARNSGNATYRGTVKITKEAINSESSIKCDTILLNEESKSDTIPTNICLNDSSTIKHEATVSKLDDNKLFYLMSRGIDEEKAIELSIIGFIEVFRKELPLEYAVELNNLLKKEPIKCKF